MSTMAKGSSFVLHRCGKAVDLVSFFFQSFPTFCCKQPFPKGSFFDPIYPFFCGQKRVAAARWKPMHPSHPTLKARVPFRFYRSSLPSGLAWCHECLCFASLDAQLEFIEATNLGRERANWKTTGCSVTGRWEEKWHWWDQIFWGNASYRILIKVSKGCI